MESIKVAVYFVTTGYTCISICNSDVKKNYHIMFFASEFVFNSSGLFNRHELSFIKETNELMHLICLIPTRKV